MCIFEAPAQTIARYSLVAAFMPWNAAAYLHRGRAHYRLQQWPKAADRDEQLQAVNLLRARLGEPARAARELAALARSVHGKPALQISSWREAARLFAKVREIEHGVKEYLLGQLARLQNVDAAARVARKLGV